MRVTTLVAIIGIAAVSALVGYGLQSTPSLDGLGARAAMAAVTDPLSDGTTQEKAGGLPQPGVELKKGRFALVVTDPQRDFLSPEGVAWSVVGESVTENGTVEHLEQLFNTAAGTGTPIFISPHYYFPHDHKWDFGGSLEHLMHDIHMFDRAGQLDTTGFEESGSDWLERYKPVINNGRTVVTSPHKIYGPESNDLVLQLRKKSIDQVILAGMSANLCTESHLRELVEQGFEVVVVADATAAAQLPGLDGYQAAVINYHFIASDVWTTEQAVARIREAK